LVAGETHDAIDRCHTAVAEWTDLGAPFEAALARTVLARAWEAAGHPAYARGEWESARAAFTAFGARRWAERAGGGATGSRGAATAGGTTQATSPAAGWIVRARFTCQVDTRTVEFAGTSVQLHDLTGLRHLGRLLADPGREFHALDLVSLER